MGGSNSRPEVEEEVQRPQRELTFSEILSETDLELEHCLATQVDIVQCFNESKNFVYLGKKYEFKELISKTPSGKVFAIRYGDNDDNYVVKVIEDYAGLPQLMLEANLLTQLNHPNLIPLKYFSFNIKSGAQYLVYPKGFGTLKSSYARQSFSKAANMFYQIASAIDFLHSQNLNHGQLTLENVVFANSERNKVWVTALDSCYGVTYGSCKRGICDRWRLGAILFFLMTGVSVETVIASDPDLRGLALTPQEKWTTHHQELLIRVLSHIIRSRAVKVYNHDLQEWEKLTFEIEVEGEVLRILQGLMSETLLIRQCLTSNWIGFGSVQTPKRSPTPRFLIQEGETTLSHSVFIDKFLQNPENHLEDVPIEIVILGIDIYYRSISLIGKKYNFASSSLMELYFISCLNIANTLLSGYNHRLNIGRRDYVKFRDMTCNIYWTLNGLVYPRNAFNTHSSLETLKESWSMILEGKVTNSSGVQNQIKTNILLRDIYSSQ